MNRRQFAGISFGGSILELMGSRLRTSSGPISSEGGGMSSSALEQSSDQSVLKHHVYAHLFDPREHPDDARHYVRPPGWDTFDNRTRFTTLRDFDIKDGRIVDYVEKIEKYTHTYKLGDVIWPTYSILYAENLSDLADEIKNRNLFLFDIYGYVPGSGPGGFWRQFKPPAGVFDLLESKLGERWLGMDNGEQDGRYIGGYAPGMFPDSANRLQQYLNFQRHFERLTDELGNKMAALISLNFSHYFLKEGVYTLIGAETGEVLPNGQIFYSFIRGAGKQYGVPWFGNASGFNRWGWKIYGQEIHDGSMTGGPTKGASLSLLKRLMYSHILYNSMLVGVEQGWFYRQKEASITGTSQDQSGKEELSPIGHLQQAAGRWVREVGQPGVMLTPIAVMLDFYAGWTFPRHLYTENVYRVWGNLPYGPGDYLTDGVLDMLYPGYQDSSYFHDESGFISPTPYGDSADCILSDAEGWLLARYPMLVVAGEVGGGAEIRDKLEAYVERGGHLLITAGNLAKFAGGVAGMRVAGPLKHFEAGQRLRVGATKMAEDDPFDLYPLVLPKAAHLLAETSGVPAAVEMPYGKGRITVLGSPFGISTREKAGVGMTLASGFRTADKSSGVIETQVGANLVTGEFRMVDKPLAKPYPLLKHVRTVLDQAFRTPMLFEVDEGLSLITCRKSPGEYTLGIANNAWRARPLKIVSHCGGIESIREVSLDQSEKGAVGYLPEGFENAHLGVSDERNIAGGDLRIFTVRMVEVSVEEIPHVLPPARPRGRALPLPGARSIKEDVLARPTFFEHFDSVVVDWKYFGLREKDDLAHEAGWIGRQKLSVMVDLTSGINLFPGLRLIDNSPADYAASMATIEDVMAKMEALGARDLILSLHRVPETNFTKEQTWQSFEATLRQLCKRARGQEMTVHLRMSLGKPPETLKEAVEFVSRVGAPNLRLAPSTALLLARKTDLQEATTMLKNNVGLWLVATPETDVAGVLWDDNAPVAKYEKGEALARILAIAPQSPIVLDAVYKSKDEEYLDAKTLGSLSLQGTQSV